MKSLVKMRSLGKKFKFKGKKVDTVLKLIFLLLSSSITLYASGVNAKVDSQKVELGEMVTLSLIISGDDVTKPNIEKLCDSEIVSTSSQTSMQIINSKVSKNYILSYKFMPQKSCKIDPIEVEIDGKIHTSEPLEILVSADAVTKDADFILTLSSDKKELFVGEPFEMTLTFKQKNGAEVVDSKFIPPELTGFWVKSESQPQRSQNESESITKVVYELAPQRYGELNITKAQIQIASRGSSANSWIPAVKWRSYFSNELTFDVKPLPEGLSLAGDFKIEVAVDRVEVDANEPVNITLEVKGSGNLEDIKSFKPNLQSVAVFDEKILVDANRLTQKIAFVSERDFVIPSFSIKYFDTKTKEIKSISTKEISVKVKNAKPQETLNIKKESDQISSDPKSKNRDLLEMFMLFLSGLIIGASIMFFIKKRVSKTSYRSSIRDPKTLLMKLLPFKDDQEVKEIIEILEKNIYSNQNIKIDKKVINKIVQRYKI